MIKIPEIPLWERLQKEAWRRQKKEGAAMLIMATGKLGEGMSLAGLLRKELRMIDYIKLEYPDGNTVELTTQEQVYDYINQRLLEAEIVAHESHGEGSDLINAIRFAIELIDP